jgi:hypothetical protein
MRSVVVVIENRIAVGLGDSGRQRDRGVVELCRDVGRAEQGDLGVSG